MAEQIYPHALTTLARVKEILSITTAGMDVKLTQYINEVTDFVRVQTGRDIIKETSILGEVYSVRACGKKRLILNNGPVQSIAAVYYSNGTPSNKNWTAYSIDDYELASNGTKSGIIDFRFSLPIGTNIVKVDYTAGWKIDWANVGTSTHTLPLDLTALAERLVVRAFKRRETGDKSSESQQAGSNITWSKELTTEDQMTLKMYRRPVLFR